MNNRLFPLKMPEHLRPGMALYRNNDQEFERLLDKPSAERKIEVDMILETVEGGLCLTMADVGGNTMATATVPLEYQKAQKPQYQNMSTQLSKLGGTPYTCREVVVRNHVDECFVPSSVLTDLRRRVTALKAARKKETEIAENVKKELVPMPKEYRDYPYLYNIANKEAKAFYEQQGLKNIQSAFELSLLSPNKHHVAPLLMQCRHCLRYTLGYCVKHGGRKPQWREPLSLVLPNGKRFRLQFDCQQCQMNIYAE